jgi:cytochrome P450
LTSKLPLDASVILGSAADPLPLLTQLREHDPVCWMPGLDAWIVTRHEDVKQLATDFRVTTDPRAFERYTPPSDAEAARMLLETPFRSTTADGISHGRRLVAAAVTPRAAERLEARMREVVEQFAAPLRGRADVVDLAEEFGVPVAATSLGRMLGVPIKDEDEIHFRTLAVRSVSLIRPFASDKKRQRMERAVVEMGNYVAELVQERIAAPREDLISDLLDASDRSPAAIDLVTGVVAALVSAGSGTTSVGFGRAMRTLLHHPEQLAELRRDRSLMPNAVEELMRFDSGMLFTPRYVLEDFELHGHKIRRGQLVLGGLMSANRDPRVFADPDRLDLRRDARAHMGFSYGHHYCGGANIARMQLRLMLGAALDFIPEHARLREHEIRWSAKGVLSQIKTLPVDFAANDVASEPRVLHAVG